MRISEIYASLQGEGLLAGTPSTFVRTSGCNLRCVWCDTPFTSWEPTGEDIGEPLLFAEVAELCVALRRAGCHVTVETAGTVLPVTSEQVADLMSISPKLASSTPPADTPQRWATRHEASRRRDDVLRGLAAAGRHQFKFVIDSESDLAEACGWLDDLGLDVVRATVFLMPQARTADELARRSTWLAQECRRLGFRLAPRHHITWFGNRRGT